MYKINNALNKNNYLPIFINDDSVLACNIHIVELYQGQKYPNKTTVSYPKTLHYQGLNYDNYRQLSWKFGFILSWLQVNYDILILGYN